MADVGVGRAGQQELTWRLVVAEDLLDREHEVGRSLNLVDRCGSG